MRFSASSIVAMAACAGLPLADFYFCVAPPWPEHAPIVIATALLPCVVFPVLNALVDGVQHQLKQKLVRALVVVVVTAATYIVAYSQLIYPLPDRFYREVGGFGYSTSAENLRRLNPNIEYVELFAAFDNEPNKVFASGSIGVARSWLLLNWLALAVALNIVTGLLAKMADAQRAEQAAKRFRARWSPDDFAALPQLIDRNAVELDPILDNTVAALGSSCGDILRHDHATGRRDIAAAAYGALQHTTQLQYDFEPANPGETQQHVRLAREVLRSRSATCLDLALLYAALLEKAHLAPAMLIVEFGNARHALGGFFDDEAERELPAVSTDTARIEALLASRELRIVETTGLSATRGKKRSYVQACDAAAKIMQNARPLALVNVIAARQAGVRPLAEV